jgi:hypothetical protein
MRSKVETYELGSLSEPISISREKIQEAWQQLEERTKAEFSSSSSSAELEQPTPHRRRSSSSLPGWSAQQTEVRAGLEKWGKISWLPSGIVTSEYPPEDISFWVTSNHFALIDLTEGNEAPLSSPRRYIYPPQKACLETFLFGEEAKGLHFARWRDGTTPQPDFLHQLIQMIKEEVAFLKVKGLWVHCKMGIGRTGILVTALFLSERIAERQTRHDTLLGDLTELIYQLRLNRNSRYFVYNEAFFALLVRYGEFLLNQLG